MPSSSLLNRAVFTPGWEKHSILLDGPKFVHISFDFKSLHNSWPGFVTGRTCLRFAIFHHGGTMPRQSSYLKDVSFEFLPPYILPGWMEVMNVVCFEGKGQDIELVWTSNATFSLLVMFNGRRRLAGAGWKPVSACRHYYRDFLMCMKDLFSHFKEFHYSW